MTTLEQQILHYDRLYRMGTPAITDEEYDRLFDTLPVYSVLRTKGVISEVPSERKEKLPMPMYSMDKVKTIEELRTWLRSLGLQSGAVLILTGKYDGISLCADEDKSLAWTRGDGEVGQRSDEHFIHVTSYPEKDRIPCFLTTFGEAIMPKKLFKKHSDNFANPRNMVAGLFNTSEIRLALNDVYFMRYGMPEDSQMNKYEQLEVLNKFNPIPVDFLRIRVEDILENSDEVVTEMLDNLYQAVSTTFEIDGIIIEVNSSSKRESLGRERNMNPAYARAIKLDIWQKGAEVDVTGVTWEVGKTGELTPVIQVTPTNIGGVTVSNVTGYNARYVEQHKIATGHTIRIIRSGDVIPKHIETTKILPKEVMSPHWSPLPDHCPSCDSTIKWDENHVELVCTNKENCDEQKIKRIIYFFYKLGFENFGEGNVRRLYREGYTTINALLCADWLGKIAKLEGWGSSSARKVKEQIDKIFETGLPGALLMQAYDVFDGKTGAKVIQPIFDTVEPKDWFDVDVLVTVPGIQRKTAEVFVKGLERYDSMKKVIKESYWITPKVEPVGDAWAGAAVCFSGVRNADLVKTIEEQGGKIASGVSKNTTHLIVKDLSDKVLGSSKCVKAKSLGVKIIPINDLV